MIDPPIDRYTNRPGELLRLLVLVGCLSFITIIAMSSYSTYHYNSNNILKHAEEDAVNICTALSDLEKPILFSSSPDGRTLPSITPDEIPGLDKRLRTFLKPFNIVKIKVYSTDKQILFSTEREIIGKIDSDNVRLQSALKGSIDTHVASKPEFRDLADELIINVKVVETYVPIRDREQNIIGCFEIYVDVTKYYDEIQYAVVYSSLVLSVIIFAVFSIIYILMRKSTEQLKVAQAKLEELAITDALTGLFNRRHIIERSREELFRIARLPKPQAYISALGFIMIDVDNFKSINDTHGHIAGDEVLIAFAQLTKGVCRQYDMVGRYGGEEFLVVLPGIPVAEIRDIAERIRNAISRHDFDVEGKAIRVTVSAGVSFCRAGETEIFQALKRADEGLYLAKRSGKDRVSTVEEELVDPR